MGTLRLLLPHITHRVGLTAECGICHQVLIDTLGWIISFCVWFTKSFYEKHVKSSKTITWGGRPESLQPRETEALVAGLFSGRPSYDGFALTDNAKRYIDDLLVAISPRPSESEPSRVWLRYSFNALWECDTLLFY